MLEPKQESKIMIKVKSMRHLPPGFEERKREFMLIMAMGMLLSFCAGFINGCSLSGFFGRSDRPRSVAGVTGGYSNAALALMAGQSREFWTPVGIILSYIGGAFLSGAMIPTFHRRAWELGPEYGPCFLVGTALYALAAILASKDTETGAYYYLSAACNGLQNGMTSMYSSNLIRTTHLTGTTTDIGIILGQLSRGHNKLAWKLYVLLLLMMSFVLGSILSYPAAKELGFNCIIINCVIFAVAGIGASVFVTLEWHISMWEFYTGVQWDWEKVLKDLDVYSQDGIEDVLRRMDITEEKPFTLEQLGNALRHKLGVTVSSKYLATLFSVADANGDGTLTKSELRDIMEDYRIKSVPNSPALGVSGLLPKVTSFDALFPRSKSPSPTNLPISTEDGSDSAML
jgi:uncharacterized membrane protein YoaK (UPF0700 family)